MTRFSLLASLAVLGQAVATLGSSSAGDSVSTKFVHVDKLDRWKVLNEHSNIYDPSLSSSDGYSASHSVHVSDNDGKYLKLDYTMNHPSDSSFLKLESNEHSSNIESLSCNNDNTLTLYFDNKSMMRKYYKLISNKLNGNNNNNNNNYYILGSHLWRCKDYRHNKYNPIIRRIKSIQSIDDDSNNNNNNDDTSKYSIVLSTDYATYLNIFENLNMKFETNMQLSHESMDTYKQMAAQLNGMESTTTSNNNLGKSKTSNNNNNNNMRHHARRLTSWLSDAWDDVVDGVTTVVDAVTDAVDDVVDAVEDAWDDVETAFEVLEGENVTFSNSSGYSWSYNYDSINDNASSTFYLDDSDHVNCLNCYAYFDLVYTYEVEIYDRSLYKLYLVGTGDAKINIEIELEESYSYEYDIDTPDIPIPYLSVDVFGIDFGFVIYGELGVGVYIEMDYIYVGASAYGSITRGIEYYGANSPKADGSTNGTMQYLSDESFDHTLIGPKLEFSSANITFYLKPTLYLELTYVGSVYFGIQPEIELSLTKDTATNATDCAIDYVPTAKLLAFVGAEIDPLDIEVVWKKEISLTVVQFVLTTLAGCITEADLTTIETYIDDLESDLGVRRLSSDSSFKNFYLDYSSATTDRYSNDFKWGKTGTEWWGNLTTLNISGDAQDSLPDEGKLLLKVRSNHGNKLTGVYITQVYDWYLPPLNENEGGYFTNVSCVSRMNFDRQSNSSYDGIYSYTATVLEYYCDVNDTYLFGGSADHEHVFLSKITLSGDFYVLMMDTHFHSGFLFDENYDHLFALSQKRKNTFSSNVSLTDARPSQGWFGDYHCTNGSTKHVTLYFQSYDPIEGNVSAVLDLGSDQYWLYGTMSFLENRLNLITNDKKRTSLNGYLTLFNDGTILYTGPAINEDDDCTGFVLQGYLDTSSLETESNNNDNNNNNNGVTIETIIDGSKLYTGMVYGGLMMFGLILIVIVGLLITLNHKGYKFCVKSTTVMMDNHNSAGYAMMDGQL